MSRNLQLLGLAAVVTLGAAAVQHRRPAAAPTPHRAAQRLDWGAALLSLSALSDSGIEHYRGSFHNQAMYAPLAVSALCLLASARDAIAPPKSPETTNAVDYLALATGILGTGFHLYNVGKRAGGFSWLNLFYSAPIGAPAALSLAGMLRWMAGLVRSHRRVFGDARIASALAALSVVSLVGTSAEAALLHFRGAYHNPAMYVPVTLPPLAAALLARAALRPGRQHPVTRFALRALVATGFVGVGFHAYGVGRNMGGWRNWSQNLLNGPPLPAPPSFTALALAGLTALDLIERD